MIVRGIHFYEIYKHHRVFGMGSNLKIFIFIPCFGKLLNEVVRLKRVLSSKLVFPLSHYFYGPSAIELVHMFLCLICFCDYFLWQLVPAWLSCLPIKGDLIEAKIVHDQLCSMVERFKS